MFLKALSLYNFRNLTETTLSFSKDINCFTGVNGSGKTSLLESIYYLGHLRSFRTLQIQRIVQYEQSEFVLFGEVYDQDNIFHTIGVSRKINGEAECKLSTRAKTKAADLANVLPVLLIHPNSYQLLDHGSKYRRQFIDWGLFHVEQSFFDSWKRFNRLLKQRNALIRDGASYDFVVSWDKEYVDLSNKINKLREDYLEKLFPKIEVILNKLINLDNLKLDYQQGWNKSTPLQDILKDAYQKDIERGYSYYGVHRADLTIKIGKHPVQDVLSRGQQKLLVIAMRLAQGLLLKELTGKSCIYLLDDVTAELDLERRYYVFSLLKEIESQVFITLLDSSGLEMLKEDINPRMFHVEHGKITDATISTYPQESYEYSEVDESQFIS